MAGPNDGTRSLVESILAPTVIAALKGSSGNIRIEYHTIGLFLDFRCLRSLLPHLDD